MSECVSECECVHWPSSQLPVFLIKSISSDWWADNGTRFKEGVFRGEKEREATFLFTYCSWYTLTACVSRNRLEIKDTFRSRGKALHKVHSWTHESALNDLLSTRCKWPIIMTFCIPLFLRSVKATYSSAQSSVTTAVVAAAAVVAHAFAKGEISTTCKALRLPPQSPLCLLSFTIQVLSRYLP